MRVLQIGNPLLTQRSQELSLDEIQSEAIQNLLSKMKETLNGIQAISSENGNALSAPQSGSLVRMILLRIDGEFVPMINPVIQRHSEQQFEFQEECFSMYDIRGTVSRHVEIAVSYLDEYGIEKSTTLRGEMSGLVQHEIDHLDGILFIDKLKEETPKKIEQVFKHSPHQLSKINEMIAFMKGN